MWDSIVDFLSSVYKTSHIRAKIIATIIALIALPIVRRFIISPLIGKIKDNEKRYKWNKTIVYSFYFLFFFIIGSIWFEGFESIATFLGLLAGGTAIALKDAISNIAGWLYIITRSPFNTDLAKTIPMIGTVNDLFKTHSGGRDLSDVPARAFTGFMALANAINNAGSTDPEKIRQALVNLDMSSESLIVPYRGIKFGADGQNEKTRGIWMQVQNGKYCTVYPFELAACKLKYPMPTWSER